MQFFASRCPIWHRGQSDTETSDQCVALRIETLCKECRCIPSDVKTPSSRSAPVASARGFAHLRLILVVVVSHKCLRNTTLLKEERTQRFVRGSWNSKFVAKPISYSFFCGLIPKDGPCKVTTYLGESSQHFIMTLLLIQLKWFKPPNMDASK